MNTNHSSLIRGLNVAVIVLAALSLISCVVGIGTMETTKGYIYDAIAEQYYDGGMDYYYDDYYYDDDWYDYFGDDLWDDDEGYWHDDHDYSHPHHTGLSAYRGLALTPAYSSPSGRYGVDDAYAAMDIVMALVNGLLIWEIVVSIVSLLLGILGLVNAGKPMKLRSVMGVGIAGAIVSFLGGHIILVALFIISAVMANKDKTATLNANMAAAPTPVPLAATPVPAPAAPPTASASASEIPSSSDTQQPPTPPTSLS